MTSPARYQEWPGSAPLSRYVECTWAGRLGPRGESYVDNVLPDGCIDIVWDGRRLFVAGPDTGPAPIPRRPGGLFAGLRFHPGLAPDVLGVPASALRDSRADVGEVLTAGGQTRAGSETAALTERLHRAGSLRAATVELERWLARRLPEVAPPDPLVEAMVAALRAAVPARSAPANGLPPATPSRPMPVAWLASDLGVGERRLHRQCTAAVGYGPKTLHRVLRFRRFLSAASVPNAPGLATLAVEAGYADQAHLSRECRRLAGTSPAALLPTWRRPAASG